MLHLIACSHTLIVTPPWRPPIPLGTWILLGLTLIAFTTFLWALWPKLRVLIRAAGENRLDRPVQRLWNTLRIAFAQSKMFKDGSAGWMHALIFWGFLILLVRALQFFILGLYPSLLDGLDTYLLFEFAEYSFNPYDFIVAGYIIVKDGVVLLVTLACCYALFRRLVTKPKRLTLSGEAILILLLILTIMICL